VRRFDSVDFRHGDGVKFDATKPSRGHATLRVQGIGVIKVRMHRNLPDGAKLGRVSIKREGSGPRARWHVVIPIEVETALLPTTGRHVGVDLGVASLFTASESVPGLTERWARCFSPWSRPRRSSTSTTIRTARRGACYTTPRRTGSPVVRSGAPVTPEACSGG
jgi:transposase